MSFEEPIEPAETVELHKPALITLFQTCWDYLKFYQDLLIKALLGYTAITGAVLAFWITHPTFKAAIWGLLLPVVLGLALATFCFFALYKNWPKINDECMDLILQDLEPIR